MTATIGQNGAKTHLSTRDRRSLAYLGVGLALGGYGIMRKSLVGILGAGATAILLYRDRTRIDSGEATLPQREQVVRSITIKETREVLFESVSDVSSLLKLSPVVEDVKLLDQNHARCFVDGPGFHFQADLIIEAHEPSRSVFFVLKRDDTDLASAELSLNETYRGTIVKLALDYPSLFGAVGRSVVRPQVIFQLDTMLMRLKQLLEAGEIARTI